MPERGMSLWVKSGHLRAKRYVRFTPESGHCATKSRTLKRSGQKFSVGSSGLKQSPVLIRSLCCTETFIRVRSQVSSRRRIERDC